LFSLVFAGDDGKVYDHPSLLATGRTGDRFVELKDEDMVRLPGEHPWSWCPGGSLWG
jgi:hypothetical protein